MIMMIMIIIIGIPSNIIIAIIIIGSPPRPLWLIYKLLKFFRKFRFLFLHIICGRSIGRSDDETIIVFLVYHRPIAQASLLDVNALCGGLMNFTTIAALRTLF